jgi:anaerobic selenocysteine-containing dehydrogenase
MDATKFCAKGQAAPELVYHKDRLKRPLRRTRPKGEADPGWEEISWHAALDQIAAAMRRIAAQHGPEAVAFSQSSPSTTAIADSAGPVRLLAVGRKQSIAGESTDLFERGTRLLKRDSSQSSLTSSSEPAT